MKDIIGYEGKYAITPNGEVYSYLSKKFMSITGNGAGYLNVALRKDGKHRKHYIHRLVAQAYIPNPNYLPCVNHKNENKTDNRLENLEWCDYKYNANYGTCKRRRAQACKKPVYCVELDRAFDSINEAAEFSGVTSSLVNKCLRGVKKTAGGYHWKYFENFEIRGSQNASVDV